MSAAGAAELDDAEEIPTIDGSPGTRTTIGEFARRLLTEQDYFGDRLLRQRGMRTPKMRILTPRSSEVQKLLQAVSAMVQGDVSFLREEPADGAPSIMRLADAVDTSKWSVKRGAFSVFGIRFEIKQDVPRKRSQFDKDPDKWCTDNSCKERLERYIRETVRPRLGDVECAVETRADGSLDAIIAAL